jgi:Protein of unknown function (DUF2971)
MSRRKRERRRRNAARRKGSESFGDANGSDAEPEAELRDGLFDGYVKLNLESLGRTKLKPTVPETLFKYEGIGFQSIQNLKAQSVFFASPTQFNDPYDCTITARIAELTDEGIERARQGLLGRTEPGPIERRFLEFATPQLLRDTFLRTGTATLEFAQKQFLENSGVSCFSEVKDDLLMWAHYGGHYRGFCLEFRTNSELFSKVKKVAYTDQIPTVDLLPLLADADVAEVVEALYCTKSKAWQYEREWRSIHSSKGTLFGYEARALKTVYFGPDIDPQARDLICIVLAAQNPMVELWHAKRSKTEFRVEFEPAGGYTPLTLARTKGWIRD